MFISHYLWFHRELESSFLVPEQNSCVVCGKSTSNSYRFHKNHVCFLNIIKQTQKFQIRILVVQIQISGLPFCSLTRSPNQKHIQSSAATLSANYTSFSISLFVPQIFRIKMNSEVNVEVCHSQGDELSSQSWLSSLS